MKVSNLTGVSKSNCMEGVLDGFWIWGRGPLKRSLSSMNVKVHLEWLSEQTTIIPTVLRLGED